MLKIQIAVKKELQSNKLKYSKTDKEKLMKRQKMCKIKRMNICVINKLVLKSPLNKFKMYPKIQTVELQKI